MDVDQLRRRRGIRLQAGRSSCVTWANLGADERGTQSFERAAQLRVCRVTVRRRRGKADRLFCPAESAIARDDL
jgi:hypothetical protein